MRQTIKNRAMASIGRTIKFVVPDGPEKPEKGREMTPVLTGKEIGDPQRGRKDRSRGPKIPRIAIFCSLVISAYFCSIDRFTTARED
jgi:hypothetical protein